MNKLKNLLIAVLICSAVWQLAASGLFGQLSPKQAQSQTGAQSDVASTGQIVLPLGVAVTTQSGCSGAQYDGAEVARLFRLLSPALTQALEHAGAPRTADARQWDNALMTAPGVWFDLRGNVPLEVIGKWLGLAEETKLTGVAGQILLCVDAGGREQLYYRRTEQSGCYVCDVDGIDPGYLGGLLEQADAAPGQFACQAEGYEQISPDTLLLERLPQPAEYRGVNPVSGGGEDGLEQLLEALSFPPGITTIYETPEGCRARSGNDTLSISDAGELTYESGGGEQRYPLTGSGQDSSVYRAVETARKLVCGLQELWDTGAGLYLRDVRQEEDGWRIEFGYVLDGICVQMADQGYAASVLVEAEGVTRYEMTLRTYQIQEQTTLLLPQRQAAAAMAGQGQAGSRLELRYRDGGDVVRAGWFAG